MTKTYYYSCSLPLTVGSVIRPGNWGRMLRACPSQFPDWVLPQEMAYEMLRKRTFPEKPSRLESNLVYLSAEDLSEFRNGANWSFDLTYKVELLDPEAPTHLGDLTLTNTRADSSSYIDEWAMLYWQGNSTTRSELVTLSPIRISEIIGS